MIFGRRERRRTDNRATQAQKQTNRQRAWRPDIEQLGAGAIHETLPARATR